MRQIPVDLAPDQDDLINASVLASERGSAKRSSTA